MCRLIETIRIEKKRFCNLDYHNKRINYARQKLFGSSDFLELEKFIKLPEDMSNEIHKCRVVYSDKIINIKINPYGMKLTQSLKIITDNEIEYPFKFKDRKRINKLYGQKEDCDDILIVKNGFVADTSIHNVIFFDGIRWWTPTTPLLKGTTITRLLKEDRISEKIIRMEDLLHFKKIMLVNAMNDWGKQVIQINKLYS